MKLYNIVIIAFLNTICAKNVSPGRMTGLRQDPFNLSQQAPPPPLNNDGSRQNMQRDGPPPPPPPLNDDGRRQNIQRDGPPPPPPPLNDDGRRQNMQKDGSNEVLQAPPPPHKFQRQNMKEKGSVLDMSGDEPYTKEKCTTDCLESGKPTKECHAHCKTGYKIYLASLAKGEGK